MKNFSVKVLVITEVFHPEEFLINDLVKEWQKQGLAIEVLIKGPKSCGKTETAKQFAKSILEMAAGRQQ